MKKQWILHIIAMAALAMFLIVGIGSNVGSIGSWNVGSINLGSMNWWK
jgi:hypothetical protein